MTVFIIWVCIAILLVGLYILILWTKNRHRSRFQVKLTILFLLFVFVPTVPLTFFVANLLTRSANVLLLPGIGDALQTSLETIRTQIEKRGISFLQEYEDPAEWTPTLQEKEGLPFIGHYRLSEGSVISVHSLRLPSSLLPNDWSPRPEFLKDALSTSPTSSLIPTDDGETISVYRVLPDSSVIVACYRVENHILNAKDEITRALGIYNTLSLLKESIIQKNLIWGLAVLLIIGLSLLSVFVARRLSRGISGPVQDLVEGMKRVAAGDLTQKVGAKAKDEFGFLIHSFNTMIQDLNESRQKLVRAERLAAWQEVARQISHEIKNSLTPISISLRRFRGYFEEKDLPSNISESLMSVEEEFRALENMAAEFSDFARMPKPEKSPIDLNEIVRSVVRFREPLAGRTEIRTMLSPELPPVHADREQMKRLLNNLIKNGVEASHDRGTITITTRKTNSSEYRVELEVQNQGEGMDEETLQKLFNPYYTTKKKGTGLGLTIVQKIVEDHNGKIQVESEKNKGTRITVLL